MHHNTQPPRHFPKNTIPWGLLLGGFCMVSLAVTRKFATPAPSDLETGSPRPFLRHRSNRFIIKTQFLIHRGSDEFIEVYNAGRKTQRRIVTRLATPDSVEVISGLLPGDKPISTRPR